jgi:hypothetical protein
LIAPVKADGQPSLITPNTPVARRGPRRAALDHTSILKLIEQE